MVSFHSEHPKWQPLYDLLAQGDVDQLVTYSQLEIAAGYDIRENRSHFYRAVKELEVANSRTVINVANKGYRIAQAREHADIGIQHQRKAKRSVHRGLRKVMAADAEALTPDEAVRNESVRSTLARHNIMLINHERRLTILERAQRRTVSEMAANAEKVEDIRRALALKGIDIDQVLRPESAGSSSAP